MNTIQFFSEDTSYYLSEPDHTADWLRQSVFQEGFTISRINIIFCSDHYLHNLNKMYLNHDTYTDIITFDQSEENPALEGEIYVSIDRARSNSVKYKIELENELCRLLIHGFLHLMGYSDKTEEEKMEMQKKEDAYLSLL